MEKPLVSVVMANRNTKEAYLRSAIESILNQTYENLEFIIIDDGSTSSDLEVIRSYNDSRITVLENGEPKRIPYSANRGFAAAKGKYIARMDSDDIALPQRLEKQVAFLESHPGIDILAARAQNFGDMGGIYACFITDPKKMKVEFFFNSATNNPTTFIRKSFLDQYSLFYDESFHYAEDYEFFARCMFYGNISEYPEILLKYRRHNKQLSVEDRLNQIRIANRVREALLEKIGLAADEKQMLVHYSVCTGEIQHTVEIGEISAWVEKLLFANAKTGVFDRKIFRAKIVTAFFVLAAKYLKNGLVKLPALLKLPMMKKALNPRYYGHYFMRLRYSVIIHRGRNNPKE